MFQRTSSLTGQLFVERSRPVGKGLWNTSLSYQRIVFDRFEGQDLDHLADRLPVVAPDGVPLFVLPDTRIAIAAHVVTVSLTYGVTDRLDLNATLPIVHTTLDRSDHDQVLFLDAPGSERGGAAASKTGVGDVFLRGKYSMLHSERFEASAGLAFRLPTADARDFHGIGTFGVAPTLVLSSSRWLLQPWLPVQAHANLGFDVDPSDLAQSEGRWGIGLDVGLGARIVLALGVLGRHPFDRLAAHGALDQPRCFDSLTICQEHPATSRKGRAPLFGFRGERADYVDLVVGGRAHLWGDTITAFANVLVPATDAGLRPEPIPLVGIEAVF